MVVFVSLTFCCWKGFRENSQPLLPLWTENWNQFFRGGLTVAANGTQSRTSPNFTSVDLSRWLWTISHSHWQQPWSNSVLPPERRQWFWLLHDHNSCRAHCLLLSSWSQNPDFFGSVPCHLIVCLGFFLAFSIVGMHKLFSDSFIFTDHWQAYERG